MSSGVGIMLSEMDIMSFFKSRVHLFTLAIVIFVFAVSPRNQLLRSLAKAMLLGAVCAILIYLSLFLDNVKVEGGRIGIVIASSLNAMG